MVSRTTVTTTVPNFVRGSIVPISLFFEYLRNLFHDSFIYAGITVAVLCLGLAFWALHYMRETFFKDLDYLEP